MRTKTDDIVISFGPNGTYSLYVPVKDIEDTKKTGKSFVEAGIVLLSLTENQNNANNQTTDQTQKMFDWMKDLAEKVA